jgi:pilus assembly protein CpaC
LATGLALALVFGFAPDVQAETDGPVHRELHPSPDTGTLELPPANGHKNELRRIELERGKSAVLKAGFNVKRVAVGDPSIADVIVLNTREIHLVAKSIGDTNVIVWDSKGTLQAAIDLSVGTPHSQIEAELGRVLENRSIRVDAAGEAVLLKGTVESPTELEQAVRVAEAFFGCRGGCDDDDDDKNRVISMLRVGGNQQVMIDVKIAEMSRSIRRNLGTNWAGTDIGGNTNVSIFSFLQGLTSATNLGDAAALSSNVNLVARITDGSDQLDLFIEAVQEDGLAKILAEPSVVARSGEPAEFLVGGEVPIPVPQNSGISEVITIEYKPFGVGVTFTPTVMGDDRIHLQLSTEVSEPTSALGVNLGGFNVPAFSTRRASTGVELGDGQSFAIAGLLRDDVTELVHEFPLLGDVPVLGALFRSTQFEKRETELVMIVTPRLVQPLDNENIPLPTDHFVEPNAFEYFFLGELEGNVFERKLRNPTEGMGLSGLMESIRPARDRQVDTELALDGTPIPSTSIEIDPWTGDSIAGEAGHRVSVSDVEGAL